MTENKNDYPFINIKELKPYKHNARLHPQDQIDKIVNSIREFGFITPVIIDENNTILVGHGRTEAAKQAGLIEVPYRRITGLTDDQKRAYILADNRLSEIAEWDEDLLKMELERIDLDMTAFGFEDFNIDLDTEDSEIIEDDVPEVPEETKAKPGQLFKLGNHRLICGDSSDESIIKRLMNGVKADLVFTDPPYKVQTRGGCKYDVGKSLHKQGKEIDFIADFNPAGFLNVLPQVFANNMNAYIFCNKELLPDYLNWGKDNGYSWNVLIWKKPTAIPIGDSHRPDIEYLLLFRKNALWNNGANANYSRCLEYNRVTKTEENGKHPTMKPVELIANELKISSNKKSVVVDFYGGSGSTLIACEQLERVCYMCEIDPKYIDVIIKRWENLTGQKAELIKE